MKALKILLAMVLMFAGLNLWSQVAINADGSDPHQSAMLDVQSNNSGVLIPRMSAAERDAISSPANGLMVFVTDVNQFYYYDDSRAGWMPMGTGGSGGDGWLIDGTDMYSIVTGNIGVGSTSPGSKLHISSDNSAWGMVRIQNSNSGANEACLSFIDGNETPFSDYWMMGVGVYGNAGDFIIGRGGMGGQKFSIDYNGNVGIGTANPGLKLDVRGQNANEGAWVQFGNSSLSHKIQFFSGDDDDPYPTLLWKHGDHLRFVTDQNGGSEKVRITSDGNVGIGTTTPDIRLQIDGGTDISPTWGGYMVVGDVSSTNIGMDDNEIMARENGNTADLNINREGGNIIMTQLDGNVGIGTYPSEKLHVNGTARVDVLQIMGGADIAEPFDVVNENNLKPGMVMSIDPENPGKLKLADKAYDKCVAGIISGAGEIKPGMIMGQTESIAYGEYPVALTGRVYCYAETSNGNIKPGDLITSSGIPGYAMKAMDNRKAQGAIIGKAMTSLEEEKGLVLVLVTLQ